MRIKQRLNVSLHPKIIEALDVYCQEHQVLKNEIVAILLLHFFSNNKSVSRETKDLLNGICLEDFLQPRKSNIKSNLINNKELMTIIDEIKVFSWQYKCFGNDMGVHDLFGN
ncbi:hypothetical protein VKI21_11365 [Cyanobacterium aponinum UTEX 3222]|uniref:Uncharacterized protein n=1 Tax=Cyanobacterium aponinum 0216 TaxID=2676140 RepID=A0A844GSB2_9CHRO|nr:hypothetical protein [Cyanobacterium aponinum]MTF37952.1 hypothetical protein [Cyanobacterium aponinum 0216]WRL39023.1 hypothetical protein VKI22_02695 [Cyanobacterium aponinum UTEX 3221]WRL40667.1 hypothetical protein VKI21_11365 [Cyanobacterium aponinum UTEX 3222]